MKSISILVPEGAVMEAVADPRYLFTTANQFLEAAGHTPLFNVQLVGLKKQTSLLGGVYSIQADALIGEVEKTDLIIIPAISSPLAPSIAANQAYFPWLVEQFGKGAEIASLCLGAFILAETGLLDGKKCSTHWAFYQEFRERYPAITIMDGHIITEELGIYSSGGANSYWNLLLYLLEKYTNREIAILASKYFAIDIDRNSQSVFAIFNGQKDHTDEEVKKVQAHIEKMYTEKLSVDELAELVAISRRSLERRFRNATNNTVAEYIQRVKVEAAKRSFEATRKNINEVMYDVGYTDTKAFRSLFKKITGLNPVAYRNKYNKQLATADTAY
ncbi:helix-turn-helix domain-containing protein [Flavihumibacter sp. CACIAM 22H1]|uniref:GlxA family transcriptional regulator n=1 Tax=Flavihumibacter sp. CACIAM 22H1 TaxID=1812911 RepID=UPI0007A8CA74|nr:helix-turn-helix domain-containing protein [Flavihumibacter sp. CACIAM 22H1]KYP13923.1 MAG: AraC family transcriptional regulator [Flavihumibacter sp. CACIAM 22H1]